MGYQWRATLGIFKLKSNGTERHPSYPAGFHLGKFLGSNGLRHCLLIQRCFERAYKTVGDFKEFGKFQKFGKRFGLVRTSSLKIRLEVPAVGHSLRTVAVYNVSSAHHCDFVRVFFLNSFWTLQRAGCIRTEHVQWTVYITRWFTLRFAAPWAVLGSRTKNKNCFKILKNIKHL